MAPVTISVSRGTISQLSFTNPEGAAVNGTLSADQTSWTLAEPLGYGRTYTVSGSAVGTDGKPVAITGTYTTVTPVEEITTSISPGDGDVVGVAAPVIVHFGYEPADKAAIEKSLKITTTPQVEGAWAWIKHDGDSNPSLDWRPKDYWPSGTVVHVESNIYGLDFGDGYYGGDNITSDFTIGRNQVVKADANAHNIVVQQDGVTVASYDASYGSGDEIGDPNRVTRSGIHVVMDKQQTTKMSNPAYGYVNVTEHWAVRISDNGEFIHQNQGTVNDQGVDNVSHGCINLSASSAEEYYNSAIYGDPVEVTGTSVPLSSQTVTSTTGRTPGTSGWRRAPPAAEVTWSRCARQDQSGIRQVAGRRAARLFHAAAVAQSAERLTRNEKVWGSIPHSGSSREEPPSDIRRGFLLRGSIRH